MDRRRFLKLLSAAVAALAGSEVSAAAAAPYRLGTLKKAYTFFNPAESEFIEAAVARLIPADQLGPGALEADVPYFIDQQLGGEYGAGARFYAQGPYGATTPYQGYQLPLTPGQLYRVGIAATDSYCMEKYGRRFAELEPARQDEVLNGLAGVAGDVKLQEVPGATFFNHLLSDTKDGFFSDPAYGGNKNMVGWKLVGFPGVPAAYATYIGRNEAYDVEPIDMQGAKEGGLASVHQHHVHVTHRPSSSPRHTTPPAEQTAEVEPTQPRPGGSFSV